MKDLDFGHFKRQLNTMKTAFKAVFLLLILFFAAKVDAQITRINVSVALAPGAPNTAVITDATGKVIWGAFSTIAPDQSATNEIQSLSIAGNAISLSLGGGSVTLPAEVDGSTTNEIQALSLAAGVVSLSLGGGSITLPDASATNEIQTLSIAGNTVSLSLGGGSVTLPANVRFIGRQVIAANTSTVTITGLTTAIDTNVLIFRGGLIMEGGAGNDWQRTGTSFSFANNPLLANEKLLIYEITP
jgi:hypothetical protein